MRPAAICMCSVLISSVEVVSNMLQTENMSLIENYTSSDPETIDYNWNKIVDFIGFTIALSFKHLNRKYLEYTVIIKYTLRFFRTDKMHTSFMLVNFWVLLLAYGFTRSCTTISIINFIQRAIHFAVLVL